MEIRQFPVVKEVMDLWDEYVVWNIINRVLPFIPLISTPNTKLHDLIAEEEGHELHFGEDN